jgi:threonyl-tRNA synthetase
MPKTNPKEIALQNIRHSLAHLLAAAMQEMFPKAQLGVGPVIENGFYYDFLLPRPLTPEDLKKLEKRMRELARKKLEFKREDMQPVDAIVYFKEKQQPFKVSLIEDLQKFGTTNAEAILNSDEQIQKVEGEEKLAEKNNAGQKNSRVESVSLYHTDNFVDLCRGGHVGNTSEIDPESFSLDRVSGAYWRGDQANPQMQRVYGLSFESKTELEKYKKLQEEIAKNDHRILGPKLGLFSFHEFSPGIPFYLPHGVTVRNILEQFVRQVSYGEGYKEVRLPQLFDSELWKISGHWDHFKDDMFVLESEGKLFALKPMNCPGHMIMYKQGLYSYKDLPLRLAEMTTLYRNELSGALSGLTRVRAFAQDDSHIFLAPEQVADEVASLLKRVKKLYGVFGMKIEDVALSTRPEKAYVGTIKEWDEAEKALTKALKDAKWDYTVNPGDGAFYGPKIDMRITDILGRKWQLATIQLDYQMPQRFELEYIAADGTRQRPVVIHRAILGSFERFLAILIEQYGGAFPAWLTPVQATILPISSKHVKAAKDALKALKELLPDLRITIDDRDESIGKKIRETEMQKIPYMLIIGDKEKASGKISVRGRGQKDYGTLALKKFAALIEDEIKIPSV